MVLQDGKVDVDDAVDAPAAVEPARRASEVRLRPIEPGDADASFALCKDFHETTPYAVFGFSRARFDKHWDAYFGRKDRQAAVVAMLDDTLVGMIWLRCGPYIYSDDGLITSSQVLCVDRHRLSPIRRARVFGRLVRAAVVISQEWGALRLVINATPGAEAAAADRLLKRSGAQLIGGNYVLQNLDVASAQ